MSLTSVGNYLFQMKQLQNFHSEIGNRKSDLNQLKNNLNQKKNESNSLSRKDSLLGPSHPSLFSAIHQFSQKPYSIQIIEKKDFLQVAREVKAQMVLKNLAVSPFLKLREVLQDQLEVSSKENERQGPLKRKRESEELVLEEPNTKNTSNETTTTTTKPHRYYLIFEGFPAGETCDLLELLKMTGKMEEERAKPIFHQILIAVEKLHSLGIVHGDLKLPNILVIQNSNPNDVNIKLKDFRFSTTSTSTQQSGEISVASHKGSPAYLAPEVTFLEKTFCGKKADTYSLGVILFTLLVGSYPITAPSLASLFELIRRGEFSIPSSISPLASDLIRLMLKVDPNERPTLLNLINHPWFSTNRSNDNEPEQVVPTFFSNETSRKRVKVV